MVFAKLAHIYPFIFIHTEMLQNQGVSRHIEFGTTASTVAKMADAQWASGAAMDDDGVGVHGFSHGITPEKPETSVWLAHDEKE